MSDPEVRSEEYDLAKIRLSKVPKDRVWAVALQSLTPGGSEYTDPALCVAHLRALLKELHQHRHHAVLAMRQYEPCMKCGRNRMTD